MPVTLSKSKAIAAIFFRVLNFITDATVKNDMTAAGHAILMSELNANGIHMLSVMARSEGLYLKACNEVFSGESRMTQMVIKKTRVMSGAHGRTVNIGIG